MFESTLSSFAALHRDGEFSSQPLNVAFLGPPKAESIHNFKHFLNKTVAEILHKTSWEIKLKFNKKIYQSFEKENKQINFKLFSLIISKNMF